MCVSIHTSDFERALLRSKLNKTMLDQWLKEQTEQREYEHSYEFFAKFGLWLGVDRHVKVVSTFSRAFRDEAMFSVMAEADRGFFLSVHEYVASPSQHMFGAARERLHSSDVFIAA